MITLTDKQIQQIFNNKAAAENGINDVLKMTLNAIMYAEEQALLQEQKVSKNEVNKTQSIKTNSCGRQLSLTIPRNRIGVFKPLLTLTLKQETAGMDRLCCELYTCGLPTAKVNDIAKKVYEEKHHEATVTNIGQNFKRELEKWRARSLDSRYLVVYLDTIHTKVTKGNNVGGEHYYVAIAVKKDYTREVIALYNNPTESASDWEKMLKKIKKRGVQKIDLVVSNGFIKGLEDKVLTQYPNASFQKCAANFQRYMLHKVRPEKRPAMEVDLKSLFDITDNSYTKENAYERADRIVNKWGKTYPHVNEMLEKENLCKYFTCLDFNFKIRPMIYTTNVMKQLAKTFKTALERRHAIPTTDSALLLLSGIACKIEKTKYLYPIYNFAYEYTFL